jgi:hypothetical protein
MEGINNSLPARTGVERLLQQMESIAAALITSPYITDFTVHDTNFIRGTDTGRPFAWLVYESGTHIYATDDIQEIRNFLETLNYYENYSSSDFCLYRYDGEKLFPVFPKVMRKWVDNKLKEYSL